MKTTADQTKSITRPIVLFSILALLVTVSFSTVIDRFEVACSDTAIALRYYLNRYILKRVQPANGEIGSSSVSARTGLSGQSLVSNEQCVIGIDAQTVQQIGKYGGSGDWGVRRPFILMSLVLESVFRPSVVAYDIIFQAASGSQQEAGEWLTDDNIDAVMTMLADLKSGEHNASDDRYRELTFMSRLAAELAERHLASQFAELTYPADGQVKAGLPVILAYIFNRIGLESDVKSSSGRLVASAAPALRPQPNAAYLCDMAIPNEQLKNIPPYYKYCSQASLPAPVLLDYATLGFINVPRDPDGIIRRLPLVLGFLCPQPDQVVPDRVFVPSLALLSVLQHWQLTPADVEVNFGRYVLIKRRDGSSVRIPIDRQGQMVLDFVARLEEYPSVSLWYLVQTGLHLLKYPDLELSPEQQYRLEAIRKTVDKRIAMVGLTAPGTTDIGPTPIDPNTAFVHVHMTAVNSILTERFLVSFVGTQQGDALLILIFLAYTVLCSSQRVLRLTRCTSLLLITLMLGYYMFIHFHVGIIPLVQPVTYIMLAYCATLFFRYFSEELDKKRIRGMFSTMVSSQVLRFLEEHPEQVSRSARHIEATVMFSDIEGFTSIAERLTAERLAALLNTYFSAMGEIIMDAGGYVDKYEGDAIMAEWGVPYPRHDHAQAAVLATVAQREKLDELRAQIESTFGVILNARYGLSSGIVAAGKMGSDQHFQYTVMGNAVNEAARLEPTNKLYGTEIIVSDATYQAAKDVVEARCLDKILLIGKSEPVLIWEIVGRKGEVADEVCKAMRAYEIALVSYWQRDWIAAEAMLAETLATMPDDCPARLLQQRIADCRQTPPPDDWQGVYIPTHKL